MELDETTIKEFLESKMISRLDQLSQREQYYSLEKSAKGVFTHAEKFGLVYEIANAKAVRKERTSELLKALAILRGGAKQAAFGTDVSPKVLILAGLTCGNLILNSLFEDNSSNTSNRGKSVTLNVDTLKEVTTDYKDRLCTPVFIGIRNGYLANEDDVRKLSEEDKGYVVTTPINAVHQMTNALP
jgi:CRISPR-associated protein Cst2